MHFPFQLSFGDFNQGTETVEDWRTDFSLKKTQKRHGVFKTMNGACLENARQELKTQKQFVNHLRYKTPMIFLNVVRRSL